LRARSPARAGAPVRPGRVRAPHRRLDRRCAPRSGGAGPVTAIAAPGRVVANMFAKGTSFVVEKGAQLVLVAIVGQKLGRAGFGRFSYASNLAVLLAFGSDLGLTTWTTRALARRPEQSVSVLGTGLRLRLAASGVVLL